MTSLYYMLPGLIVFILSAVPLFYFNHLLNQEDYCKEIIKVNNLQKGDNFLKERCSALDIDALFESNPVVKP